MITRADIHLIDPELRDLLVMSAINAALAYGQPGSPGWHRAMRQDARRALRQLREREQGE
jgi:hypothetical protein